MPLYSYKCVGCQFETDVVQLINADAPECSVCGTRLKKQLTIPILQLKSARRKWCETWTLASKPFKFGDWRDHTPEAEGYS